jgi:hypothetical protein
VLGSHPLKDILTQTIPDWDHTGTPQNVRDNFWKIIKCGTPALGAEVYASATETKIVYHTCKSRFCPSCGARASELWRDELDASLPNMPYVGINLTMPKVFWPFFEQNRHLLHDLPALGAAAIEFWAKGRYGAQIVLTVVQQTYGGFLNFYPHLHTVASAGGLALSTGQWIPKLEFDAHQRELMLAWRYAVLAYLDEAIKSKVIMSDLSEHELRMILQREGDRDWNIFVGAAVNKRIVVDYCARYIRKPPIAQRRITRTMDRTMQYMAKDTKGKCLTPVAYTNVEFVALLMPHVIDRFRNSMRYFGLLSPRCKILLSSLFFLLKQKKRPRPARLSWAISRYKAFGTNPLIDGSGQQMYRIGRLGPVGA